MGAYLDETNKRCLACIISSDGTQIGYRIYELDANYLLTRTRTKTTTTASSYFCGGAGLDGTEGLILFQKDQAMVLLTIADVTAATLSTTETALYDFGDYSNLLPLTPFHN